MAGLLAAVMFSLAPSVMVAPAQAQGLSAVLGLDLGASMAEARQVLLQRDGVVMNREHSDAETLVCAGGTLIDEAVSFWLFAFTEDQLHTAQVFVRPEEDAVIATFHELVARFTEAYGEPDTRHAFFDEPYADGDGFETYAIQFDKGHFAAIWWFRDGHHENVISISIDRDLYIPIVFQNSELVALALAQEAAHPKQ